MKIIKNQENDYNCGLVCLQHAYETLTNKEITQRELEGMIGTNTEGYSHSDLVSLLTKLNLIGITIYGSKELIKYSKEPDSVIILGWTPFYEHYSIFLKIEDNQIYLNEPDSPSYIAIYDLKEFEKAWKDSEANTWAIVIKLNETKTV